MDIYKIFTSEYAINDLKLSRDFYSQQSIQLGDYFFDSIVTDIESLQFYAGIHNQEYNLYRMLAKRFPYSIYYDINDDTVVIIAILDQRQNPIKSYNLLDKRV